MKSLYKPLLLGFALLLGSAAATAQCVGRFPNIATDFCWSCMYPMKLMGNTIVTESSTEDNASSPNKIACGCGNVVSVGLPISFWEPARLIEVTRTPYCFMTLGKQMDGPVAAPDGTVEIDEYGQKSSFYQAHVYLNAILYFAHLVMETKCIERAPFDMVYNTEFDPAWHDDEMTMMLNPEVSVFSSPVAVAACAGDCVATQAGFPLAALHWCAGCNGTIFPLNGIVRNHVGGVQASALIAQRIAAKLHRQGLMWAGAGEQALCGYYVQPVMDKTNYKISMVYPIPQTDKGIDGHCCQPFGRSTVTWGAGKEFPIQGEDFSYQLYRKRDCCQGRYQ